MILEFSVENFLSFKDKITFSMLAESSKELPDNYLKVNGKKILKTAAIYGANASGKSNLFKALANMIFMLLKSDNYKPEEKLPIKPFLFNEELKISASAFEIKFIVDKIRYIYGFRATEDFIFEEYLYYYPNGRKTKIFDRSEAFIYSFPKKDAKLLNDLSQKNAPNKLFISTATSWNYEKTKIPYLFLINSINFFDSIDNLKDVACRTYNKYGEQLKKVALEFLKKADFNIVDFIINETEVPKEMLINIPESVREYHSKVYNIMFKHKGSDALIAYNEESAGTRIIFTFIPYIMEAISNQKVLIIDELDKSLHPYLVELIVKMFNDKEINENNAQLIFNTHDTNLLNQNILRRDQIWFTEKDTETSSSDLYRLSDFSVRKEENFEKGYLLGRYGAVPLIKNDINL